MGQMLSPTLLKKNRLKKSAKTKTHQQKLKVKKEKPKPKACKTQDYLIEKNYLVIK
tara:strand:- start:375 stop:542 length:168 start_codon:yes stop_codon:yes gene_type:complete